MAEEIKPVEDKIKEISAEVKKQIKIADSISITSNEDVAKATEFLSGIKARIKKAEELRTFFVKPLNDQVKNINEMFKSETAPLIIIETKIKRSIADFKIEEERKAKIEQERLEKIRAKANEKREEKGIDPIVDPVKTVELSDQTVKTDSGKTTTKKVWKYRIVDIDKVPRKYLRCEVAHSEVIGAINSGMREIDGLEIYEDYQVSVTSR